MNENRLPARICEAPGCVNLARGVHTHCLEHRHLEQQAAPYGTRLSGMALKDESELRL